MNKNKTLLTQVTEDTELQKLLADVVTLSEYAKAHDIATPRAHRLARKGKFPGAFRFLGSWVIDKDTPVPKLPEPHSHVRADGRKSFKVYMTPDERKEVDALVGIANVIDTRAQAKARRDAKEAE